MKAGIFKFLVFLTCVSGASPSSEKLNLIPLEDGTPNFEADFATRTDKVIAFEFSVRGSELVGDTSAAISPVEWSVWNKDTGVQLSPWVDARLGQNSVTPDSTQVFAVELRDPRNVLAVVKNLANSRIVISIQKKKFLSLDLEELCEKHPEKFNEFDTAAQGC